MREQKTKAQVKKPQQILDNTHPMSTHWHSHINQLPPHIPFPIIYNNNTMDIEFLEQMRKCNKSGIVSNDEISNLHLGSDARVWVSISLPPARYQPHLLIPSAQTINQTKAKNPEMRFNSQQIVSYWLGLRTQNPVLKEVVTRSTCWNKEERP